MLRRGQYELSVDSDHIAAYSLAELENLAGKNGFSVRALVRRVLPHNIFERNVVIIFGKR